MRLLSRVFVWLLCCVAACAASNKLSIALDPATFPAEMRPDVQQIDAAFQRFPNEASVLYQVASLHARAGHIGQALAALHKMADVDAGLQPRPRDFPGLERNLEFQQLCLSVQRRNLPVQNARLAYELGEGDLVPEGIAWSAATKKLYLGSIKRKIVALSEDGTAMEFITPAARGLGIVLGVRVDDRRGELWAVSGWFGGTRPADLVSGLFCFKLTDGSLVHAYNVGSSEKDLLNDLVVTKDGVVYATATNGGTVYRIDPASDRVEKFLPGGSLPDPNGIALSEDEKYLFVAGWYGISRVNLKNRKVDLLEKPANVADGCLDGLYLYAKSDLIGVQNCNHDPGRILRFHLLFSTRIDSVTVLESYNPMFHGITTAAIAGNQLYFMANTQSRKVGQPNATFDPLKILRLNLK